MNKAQLDLLTKSFRVNEHFSVSRSDYEGLPCAMLAWTWSDRRMEELAKAIADGLCKYDVNDHEGMMDDFYTTMENEAVKMGMEYYEDFDEDYLAELEYEFRQII